MLSFSDLPEETQIFALDPANHAYIGLVNRLKEVGREKFEQLAESIQVVLNSFNR